MAEKSEGGELGPGKLIVIVFFVTFALWWANGSPERWDKKFEVVAGQEKESLSDEPFFMKMILKGGS